MLSSEWDWRFTTFQDCPMMSSIYGHCWVWQWAVEEQHWRRQLLWSLSAYLWLWRREPTLPFATPSVGVECSPLWPRAPSAQSSTWRESPCPCGTGSLWVQSSAQLTDQIRILFHIQQHNIKPIILAKHLGKSRVCSNASVWFGFASA